MDDDKVKKPTTIPVSSFDDDVKKEETDNTELDVLDEGMSDEVDSLPELVPQPAEFEEEALQVEAEPPSASSDVAGQSSERDQDENPPGAPGQVTTVPGNVESEPSPAVDWAKRAESEPAVTVASPIPDKHSHILRNILVGMIVLVLAGVATYAVYAFAMPKDQAANGSSQTIRQQDIAPESEDPTSSIDSILIDEIDSETEAVDEQTANETQAVNDLNKETSEVPGAYDESSL